MASLVRYYFRKLGANFVDFSLNYPSNDLTLNGSEVVLLGSSGVDRVYLQKGIKFNFSNSGTGTDEIYLEGSFAEYTLTARGTSTLVLGAAQANTQITLAQEDKVFFNNGSIAVADLLTYAIARSANLASPTNPATPAPAVPSLNAAETSLNLPSTSNANGSSKLDSILRAYTKDPGGVVFAQPYAGVQFIVTGHNGVDKVFVAKGGVVIANNLGSGIDLIYLSGFKNEYSPSTRGSSVLVLTRGSEQVTLAAEDRVIFANGAVLVRDAITAADSAANWRALSLEQRLYTPGVSPQISIKSGQDAYLTARETSIDLEVSYAGLVAGDTLQLKRDGSNLGLAHIVNATEASAGKIGINVPNNASLGANGSKAISAVVTHNGTDLEGNPLTLTLDNRPLNPPTISLGQGVSGSASQAEATAASGVVTVQGDSGSTLLITFTDSATPTPHYIIRSLNATGAAQALTLLAAELGSDVGQLQDGSISVSASAQYAPLVSGFVTPSTSSSASFTLDRVAPAAAAPFASVVGNLLSLSYNSPLDASNTVAPTLFQVKSTKSTPSDGTLSLVPVSAVKVQGSSVELTLASGIASGSLVTVSFVDPTDADDANSVQDLAGNDAPSFANQPVANLTPAAPNISSVVFTDAVGNADVGKAGTVVSVVLTFNEPVQVAGTVTFLFRIGSTGSSFNASYTAAAPVVAGKTITLTTTLPAGMAAADNGNPVLTGITLAAGASITGIGSGLTFTGSSLGSSPISDSSYRVDNSAPTAATLALGSGVAGGATLAEATASSGVLTVMAESGANLLVTFTDSADATHTAIKTLLGQGATAVPVLLTAADLASLGISNASLAPVGYQVSATATDAAGNSSPAATASFSIDPSIATPVITLGAGVSDGAALAEATASSGVIILTTESGSTVLLTFTDSATPTAQRLVKTVISSGAEQAITLLGNELGNGANQLHDGSISVTAIATDSAGNVSSAGSSSFSLDSTIPNVTGASVLGKKLTLNFNEPMDSNRLHRPAWFPFTVQSSSSNGDNELTIAVSNYLVSGSQVLMTLAQAIPNGDLVTLAFYDANPDTDDANAIQDAAGNDMPSFTSRAVRNETPTHTPAVRSLVTSDALGDSKIGKAGTPVMLVLTFNEPVVVVGSPGFNLRIGSSGAVFYDQGVTSPAANAVASTTLTLRATLPSSVTEADNGNIVLLGITLDPLRDSITGSNSGLRHANGALPNSVIDSSYLVDNRAPVAALSIVLGHGVSGVANLVEATASDGVVRVTGNSGVQVLVTFTDSSNSRHSITKTVTGAGETPVPVVLTAEDLAVFFTVNSVPNSAPVPITVTATVTDAAGNSSPAASASFSLDTATPAPRFSLGADVSDGATLAEATASTGVLSLTAESGSTVLLTFTDSALPTAHRLVKTVTASGAAQAITLLGSELGSGASQLSDGSIGITATATDAAGNVSSVGSSSFTLDSVAPAFASGAGAIGVVGNKITLNFNETLDRDFTHKPTLSSFVVKTNIADKLVSLAVTSITIRGSRVVLSLAVAIPDGGSASVAYTDPSAGDDSWAIQDAAGNDLASFAALPVANQKPATPVLALGAGVSDGATQAEATASAGVVNVQAAAGTDVLLTFTDSSNALHSITKTVKGNGAIPVPVVLTVADLAAFTVIPSVPAAIRVTATATDLAGNSSAVASASFTLDTFTNTPVLTLGAGVSGTANRSEASDSNGVIGVTVESGSSVLVTFTDSAMPTAHSLVKTVIGTGVVQAILLANSDLGQEAQQLQDGSITVTATASDVAGNVSRPGSSSFVLDASAPTLTPPANGTPTLVVVGNKLTLHFSEALDSSTAPPSSAFAVYYTLLGGSPQRKDISSVVVTGKQLVLDIGATIILPGTSVTLSYTAPGSDAASAVIQDLAGNDAASFSQTVANLTPARPTVVGVAFSDESGDAHYGKPGALLTATVTFNEPVIVNGLASFAFRLVNGPAFVGSYTPPANAPGSASIRFAVKLPDSSAGASNTNIQLFGIGSDAVSHIQGYFSGKNLLAGEFSGPFTDSSYWVDSSAPNAPELLLGTGIADGVSRAEATASSGVLAVSAESGSNVVVTLTDSLGHAVSKTLLVRSSAEAVTLVASDVGAGAGQLSDGSIRVSATATDLAGNTSSASSSSFVLNVNPPEAPLLTLDSSLSDTATRSEAIASSGVVMVQAESGSRVLVTFTDSATPTAHSVIKTVTARGRVQVPVTLTANDLGAGAAQLSDGTIGVSASATDTDGNVSPSSNPSRFVLDTLAPQLLSAQVVGNVLTLRYDSALATDAAHLPLPTAFAVQVDNVANAVSAVKSSINSNTLLLTLTNPVPPNATVSLSYTAPAVAAASGPVQDLVGNAAATVSNFSVTDSTPLRPVMTAVDLYDSDTDASSKYVGKQGSGGLSATVSFSEAVNVSGTVTLTFADISGAATFTGTIAADANASSFSRTKAVSFTDTLPAGNYAVYLNRVNLGGNSIRAETLANGGSGGVLEADSFALGPLWTGYVVDNTAPLTIYHAGRVFAVDSSNAVIDPGVRDTLRVGDRIVLEVPVSEAVTVNGIPALTFSIGGVFHQLAYTASFAGSLPNRIYLSYTIATGDADNEGIRLDGAVFFTAGASFIDLAGNESFHLGFPVAETNHVPWLKVDALDPTIRSLVLLAPDNGRTAYHAGEKLLIAVTFSEKVAITGTPRIALTVGSSARSASYDSSNPLNTDAVKYFSYTIAAGETDSDGISIAANALVRNGGSIRDASDNAAKLDSKAVAADSNYQVDTSAPAAPTLALGSGVSDGANLAEALASSGVLTVKEEVGSTVLITFTDNASPTRHTVIKTLLGSAAAQPVTLAAIDLGGLGGASNQLQDGTINVSALVQDGGGNTGPVANNSFTLATHAPSLLLSLANDVGNGVDNGATKAEATASSGVIKVRGEADSRITLTFSDSADHRLVRSLTGSGSDQAVTLAASDLGSGLTQLGDGLISVSASSVNGNGNGNGNSAATQFVLDTQVPTALAGLRSGLKLLPTTSPLLPPAAGDVSGDITLEAWVYVITNGNGNSFLNIDNAGSGGGFFALGLKDGKLSFSATNGLTSIGTVTDDSDFVLNRWNHVAVTVASGNSPSVTLYINGATVKTGSLSAAIASLASRNVLLGYRQTGAIGDVRIYDDARTAAEITSDMVGTVDTGDSQLKGYYPLSRSATASGISGGGSLIEPADLAITNPELSFSDDTDTQGDYITSTHTQTISLNLGSGLAANDVLWGSLDDGNSWTVLNTLVSGTTLRWANAHLLPGSHTLKFQVKDLAGNEGPVFSQAYATGALGPVLTLGAGVPDGLSRTEASAASGVITLHTTSGSSVVVTFADAQNHKLSKTLVATGPSTPVTLASSDIGTGAKQLYNGPIRVTAQAAPINGVVSEESSISFNLYADMLALGSGVADGANASEVLQSSGVVTLFSASGATVLLTFADTATPTAHSVVKTLIGSGSVQAVTLTAAEIGTGVGKLQDGTISVKAVAYDANNNPNNSDSASFFLDTLAPTTRVDNKTALRLDPAHRQYVQLPSAAATVKSDLTLEAWVYVSAAQADWVSILDLASGTGSLKNNRLLGINAKGQLAFKAYSEESIYLDYAAPSALPLNSWHHVAVTLFGIFVFDPAYAFTVTLYVDGEVVSINTAKSNFPHPNATFSSSFVGHSNLGNADFNGYIRDVRIYGDTRSAGQIGSDKDGAVNTNDSSLVGYFPFTRDGASGKPGSTSATLFGRPKFPVTSISLSADTGVTGDFVTSTAAQTVTTTLSAPLLADETLLFSLNGGISWTEVNAAAITGTRVTLSGISLLSGSHTLGFAVKDTAGNLGPLTLQPYSLDTTPPTTYVQADVGLKLVPSQVAANSQFVTLPQEAAAISGDLTLEAWVFANGTPGNWARILDLNDAIGLTNNIIVGFDQNKLSFTAFSAKVNLGQVSATSAFPIHGWHHVAVTVGGASGHDVTLYLDGTPVPSTGSLSANIPSANRHRSFIGHSNYTGDPDFDGTIRELHIYDHALTPVQIRNDMAGIVNVNINALEIKGYYPLTSTNDARTTSPSGISGVAQAPLSGNPITTIPTVTFSKDTGIVGDFRTSERTQYITIRLNATLDESESLWGSVDTGTTWTPLNRFNITNNERETIFWPDAILGEVGQHENGLQFQVRDLAGNVGTTWIHSYRVDPVI